MQTNGVPTGPPSPQLQDEASFSPNRSTLLMNPGDRLKIRIFDNKAAGALETSVQDLTTGRTGYMLASAANGFASTSIATCPPTVLSQIINLGVMDASLIMPNPDCAGHGHVHGHPRPASLRSASADG